MLWIVVGIVVLCSFLVPLLLPMDSKDTHKNCKYCRKAINVEETRCRFCKKILIDYPEDATSDA